MNHLIAVLEGSDDQQVVAAGRAVADLLGVDARQLLAGPGSVAVRTGRVLGALGGPDVAGAALSAAGSVCWDVVTRVAVPVVVVPRRCTWDMQAVSHVLLPLDGSVESAVSVAALAQRAVDAGADVTAVHVFEPSTVPAFWDQAAHSGRAWTREFLRRNLPRAVHLDLSRGRPADEVLAAARRTGTDLVVLGWRQQLDGDRAATVRQALGDGGPPVLLVRSVPPG